MKSYSLIVMAAVILAGWTFAAALFINNLPNFCANPDGGGNWVVQPFCK